MLSRPWLSISLRAGASARQKGLRYLSSTRACRDLGLSALRVDYEEKYAEKLRRRAQEQGKNVADLRAELKEQDRQRRLQKLKEDSSKAAANTQASPANKPLSPLPPGSAYASTESSSRKDRSPVKPLSSILNLDKVLEKPHTQDQLSLLWRAYHESRAGGTGRGYLCATVPVENYENMLDVASKYPTFVLPVPRENMQVEEGLKEPAYELYLMQWGFHGPPPEPSAPGDSPPKASSNPQTSTILFTPLQEYKLRQSFATPYLVLTHYTDLVKSHGLVLLHGEITPSGVSADVGVSGDNSRYMLSQQDAQLLAIHVQRFYLWNKGSDARAEPLRAFHETPELFKWEDLFKHTDFSA